MNYRGLLTRVVLYALISLLLFFCASIWINHANNQDKYNQFIEVTFQTIESGPGKLAGTQSKAVVDSLLQNLIAGINASSLRVHDVSIHSKKFSSTLGQSTSLSALPAKCGDQRRRVFSDQFSLDSFHLDITFNRCAYFESYFDLQMLGVLSAVFLALLFGFAFAFNPVRRSMAYAEKLLSEKFASPENIEKIQYEPIQRIAKLARNALVVEASEAKSEIAAAFLHDIKAPLLALEAGIRSLEKGSDKGLGTVKKGRDRILAMISHFSHIQSNELPENIEPVDVGEILAQVTEEKRDELPDLKVDVQLSFLKPLKVMAKKEMLARILSNLIQNAYEACLEASTSCQVTLAATCSGPQGPVTIHVQDNGPGFLKTPFDQYFERGFSLKHSKEPRGLGLYFAQKHVQSWGGNISLQNTDRGARASVDLAVR